MEERKPMVEVATTNELSVDNEEEPVLEAKAKVTEEPTVDQQGKLMEKHDQAGEEEPVLEVELTEEDDQASTCAGGRADGGANG